MTAFLLPIVFITALGILLAIVIVIANKHLKVWEDPRIDAVAGMLPGANCGACGAPGCRAFAEKVVEGVLSPAKCTVGGATKANAIASYLGVDAGKEEKKVARLLCAGGKDVAKEIAHYIGHPTCRAAATVAGGGKACVYGCLGFGDCQTVCKFHAITMRSDGIPVVDFEKCTACGDCVKICPKGLFVIMPAEQHLLVQCKSPLAGEDVTKVCKVGCTACGKCAMDAPGLISMQNNLPVIHSQFLSLENPKATFRCPTGAIVWLEGQQFPTIEKNTSELQPTYKN